MKKIIASILLLPVLAQASCLDVMKYNKEYRQGQHLGGQVYVSVPAVGIGAFMVFVNSYILIGAAGAAGVAAGVGAAVTFGKTYRPQVKELIEEAYAVKDGMPIDHADKIEELYKNIFRAEENFNQEVRNYNKQKKNVDNQREYSNVQLTMEGLVDSIIQANEGQDQTLCSERKHVQPTLKGVSNLIVEDFAE